MNNQSRQKKEWMSPSLMSRLGYSREDILKPFKTWADSKQGIVLLVGQLV